MSPSLEKKAHSASVAASSDRLLRTAYLLCSDRGHAEDLVQTTLLRVARRWRTARDNPEAYAREIVVNLAKDRWRLLGRRPREVPLEFSVDAAATYAEPDAAADRDELIRASVSQNLSSAGPAQTQQAVVLTQQLTLTSYTFTYSQPASDDPLVARTVAAVPADAKAVPTDYQTAKTFVGVDRPPAIRPGTSRRRTARLSRSVRLTQHSKN